MVHLLGRARERTCRGCGCSDNSPCLGNCAWVLLDVDQPTGVCSQCAIDLRWHPGALAAVGRPDPQDVEVFDDSFEQLFGHLPYHPPTSEDAA